MLGIKRFTGWLILFLVVGLSSSSAFGKVEVPKKGIIKKQVEQFIDKTYDEVQTLKLNGFRQYYFYEREKGVVNNPIPIKKPDYRQRQMEYLKRYLKMRNAKPLEE